MATTIGTGMVNSMASGKSSQSKKKKNKHKKNKHKKKISLANVVVSSPMDNGQEMFHLLNRTTIRDLGLKEKAIVNVSENTTLGDALQILSGNRILSVPVSEASSIDYLGFIDVLDILTFAINMYASGTPQIEATKWGDFCQDIDTLSHRGVRFGLKPVKHLMNASKKDEWLPVYENGTLLQLIEGVFYKGIHHVPVYSQANTLINLVSQSDIIRLMAQNMNLLGGLGRKTVKELNLGTRYVISMSIKAQASASSSVGLTYE